MACPFCLLAFESFDSRYVSHLLAEHPQAQICAAIGFLAASRLRNPVTQFFGYAGVTVMAWLLVQRSFR